MEIDVSVATATFLLFFESFEVRGLPISNPPRTLLAPPLLSSHHYSLRLPSARCAARPPPIATRALTQQPATLFNIVKGNLPDPLVEMMVLPT